MHVSHIYNTWIYVSWIYVSWIYVHIVCIKTPKEFWGLDTYHMYVYSREVYLHIVCTWTPKGFRGLDTYNLYVCSRYVYVRIFTKYMHIYSQVYLRIITSIYVNTRIVNIRTYCMYLNPKPEPPSPRSRLVIRNYECKALFWFFFCAYVCIIREEIRIVNIRTYCTYLSPRP